MHQTVPRCVIVHPFRSKIAAYNAISPDPEWDIVLAASDDMWCIQTGWDSIIREAMSQHFPDLDGCLWFSDGRQDRICTFIPSWGGKPMRGMGISTNPIT